MTKKKLTVTGERDEDLLLTSCENSLARPMEAGNLAPTNYVVDPRLGGMCFWPFSLGGNGNKSA